MSNIDTLSSQTAIQYIYIYVYSFLPKHSIAKCQQSRHETDLPSDQILLLSHAPEEVSH